MRLKLILTFWTKDVRAVHSHETVASDAERQFCHINIKPREVAVVSSNNTFRLFCVAKNNENNSRSLERTGRFVRLL